ncbi:hypothetical protein [Micromonospora sp. WMMD737]|uniref:hypothetical protein n=1 Tax=Micromonospora sp. WMMD737 TaxID=3404113 RepID=UPI003B94B89A
MIALSTAVTAKGGILVKDRLALERMRIADTVLFDKTGTLPRGEHVVSGVAATAGSSEADVLAVAAAVEADSEHPSPGPSSPPPLTRAYGAPRRGSGHCPAVGCAPRSTRPAWSAPWPSKTRSVPRPDRPSPIAEAGHPQDRDDHG